MRSILGWSWNSNTFATWCKKADSFEQNLMLEKIESTTGRGWQRMRWLDGVTTPWRWVWVDSVRWWWTRRPGMLWPMASRRISHNWATELNWTEDGECFPKVFDWLFHRAITLYGSYTLRKCITSIVTLENSKLSLDPCTSEWMLH